LTPTSTLSSVSTSVAATSGKAGAPRNPHLPSSIPPRSSGSRFDEDATRRSPVKTGQPGLATNKPPVGQLPSRPAAFHSATKPAQRRHSSSSSDSSESSGDEETMTKQVSNKNPPSALSRNEKRPHFGANVRSKVSQVAGTSSYFVPPSSGPQRSSRVRDSSSSSTSSEDDDVVANNVQTRRPKTKPVVVLPRFLVNVIKLSLFVTDYCQEA
jgi:hypothetical protein